MIKPTFDVSISLSPEITHFHHVFFTFSRVINIIEVLVVEYDIVHIESSVRTTSSKLPLIKHFWVDLTSTESVEGVILHWMSLDFTT